MSAVRLRPNHRAAAPRPLPLRCTGASLREAARPTTSSHLPNPNKIFHRGPETARGVAADPVISVSAQDHAVLRSGWATRCIVERKGSMLACRPLHIGGHWRTRRHRASAAMGLGPRLTALAEACRSRLARKTKTAVLKTYLLPTFQPSAKSINHPKSARVNGCSPRSARPKK